MMFERLNAEARDALMRARQEAQVLRHGCVGTEHLLLALLDEQAGGAYAVLHHAGVDRERVLADLDWLVGKPSKILSEEDAAALRTIGIDLDAVLARIEDSFGPGALDAPRPASRRGLFGRKQSPRMMFSRRAKKVIELSLREALRLGHNYIGTEHLLLGLIREGEGLAAQILTKAGLTLGELRQATLTELGKAA
jgi:ATP-dependent Clp protease ATP-binding subunit ClpA